LIKDITNCELQIASLLYLKCLVLQVVEKLVEGRDVGAHLNPEVLQPVDRHQVNDDRESIQKYTMIWKSLKRFR
jgi:hypothetical protein